MSTASPSPSAVGSGFPSGSSSSSKLNKRRSTSSRILSKLTERKSRSSHSSEAQSPTPPSAESMDVANSTIVSTLTSEPDSMLNGGLSSESPRSNSLHTPSVSIPHSSSIASDMSSPQSSQTRSQADPYRSSPLRSGAAADPDPMINGVAGLTIGEDHSNEGYATGRAMGEDKERKRKISLGNRARRRLSSILHPRTDKDRESGSNSSRRHRESSLTPSVASTPGTASPYLSGSETPDRLQSIGKALPSSPPSEDILPMQIKPKTRPPQAASSAQTESLSASPSPVILGIPAASARSVDASDAVLGTNEFAHQDLKLAYPGAPGIPRSASLWSYDFNAADDESSDGEEYFTPTDGLSEVAEEDEEGDDDTKVASSKFVPESKETIAVANETSSGLTHISGDSDEPVQRAPVINSTLSVLGSHIINRDRISHQAPVDQSQFLRSDLAICKDAVALALTNHMRDAEQKMTEADPQAQHMYIQNAGAVIQAMKGMMTFDNEDLQVALEIAKGTSSLADSIRKPAGSLGSRLVGIVKSNAINNIRSMNIAQKHAELVYAESLLIKAVLGIVAGGSWVGLVNEALNMRSAYGIYRTLQQYVESGDDPELDEDFLSGVELGTGLSSLMLSLLPGKVLRVAEIFGYTGDRKVALRTLMAAGGWREGQAEPDISAEHDGIRRPICDLVLLSFHLLISMLMPVTGVDVALAKNILKFNLNRGVNVIKLASLGLFFLYFQSRLQTLEGNPEKANETLQNGLMQPAEYLQLQHICLFDLAVNNLMLCNFNRSFNCFEMLAAESSWSKATYKYSTAACLAELAADAEGDFDHQGKVDALMAEVPKSMRRLAGKSVPIEKFVSRKARKYAGQNGRLLLPAIELGYFFGALPNAPPRSLYHRVIPRIRKRLDVLSKETPETHHGGKGYRDDYCLANFLLGTALSFAAYPRPEAIIPQEDIARYPMTMEAAAREAHAAFDQALEYGSQIELDHWIVYYTHYEKARLYSREGDNASARHHLELIMSAQAKSQGKYSMESALMLKTHAALQVVKESPTSKMQ